MFTRRLHHTFHHASGFPASRRAPWLRPACLLAALLLLGVPEAAWAGPQGAAKPAATPRVIPFPSPPPGPKIRRVTHDAPRPVKPGARVTITVLTVAGMKVTASLGSVLRDIPCVPSRKKPDTYVCEALVPEAAVGVQRARAQVGDPKGRSSTLSAATPIVIEASDPWREVNPLNARLRPAYFAPGSDALDDEARAALAIDADALKALPSYAVVVEGRCDPSEPGDLQDLSRRRAEAAMKHLVSLGVAQGRLKAVALAGTQPLVNPKDESVDHAPNRTALVLFEPPASPAAR